MKIIIICLTLVFFTTLKAEVVTPLPEIEVKNIDVLVQYLNKNCIPITTENQELCSLLIHEINNFKAIPTN